MAVTTSDLGLNIDILKSFKTITQFPWQNLTLQVTVGFRANDSRDGGVRFVLSDIFPQILSRP